MHDGRTTGITLGRHLIWFVNITYALPVALELYYIVNTFTVLFLPEYLHCPSSWLITRFFFSSIPTIVFSREFHRATFYTSAVLIMALHPPARVCPSHLDPNLSMGFPPPSCDPIDNSSGVPRSYYNNFWDDHSSTDTRPCSNCSKQ